MSSPALQCRGVSKYFFKKGFFSSKGKGQKNPVTVAVAHINLEVARGETLGVVGPNGSGKSTLIRLISTLLYPDCGTILVFGHFFSYD
ncbi:ABC-2 type transport system ATP-binding protein [Candidatus Hakubella thermalkaliphila]|uniref:ABC-2 type transport system ATP-binding protein n=2 Tax=Candidatus Hakubella thermalkaliphila TaxID=2754717 RepID=A0A6V8PDM0_9ACTN|nr:ATP-binding cassette domain-containing protein [Candidatus Hakubella thermalkaliphila]GFP30809.1 ABC-2 type transport system ATP-binding protein [Candidatus Hakubella thermalkaliphila]GFP37254.1 ABC-2 type transport system ATP-binding protein [Candidatus Hakubella thermalkaliphila]GFP42441.1 ABC-2 type transport system ATP-binding protein [Candidatus Hakubella thermalkaliphila]